MTLMTIGDFARETGLTPKALRLYDDLGLLRPAEVDPHSGYRKYAASQLQRARLVATLRILGMPLARIRQVVDGSNAGAARDIETYWRQIEADTESRRRIVTTLIHQLRNEAHDMTTASAALHAELGSSHRQGRRDAQQDALLVTADLIAVADGFGERDDVAPSALAAFAERGLAGAIAELAGDVSAALPNQPVSGTTLTAVALAGGTAQVTHIGDARVWLVRDGEVRQVTHDHTVVAALIEAGELTADEARAHEHRSLLNRALSPGVVADEIELELHGGDRLVLTTDGVHSYVDDLDSLLTLAAAPQDVAAAVARAVTEAGEPDNHTIVVVDLT
ncbi:MerR family transcriptional regulator [Nocardioides jensenii]|uniref:MerR family transcriptional regulator n=1 Tax=Nocardioides jensenii TaxID=1843 RepID=UPI0008328BF8|nr:MerR family transcriptional regulator [Nocardioides jensenii]